MHHWILNTFVRERLNPRATSIFCFVLNICVEYRPYFFRAIFEY
ncbi:MAG: hypothetical protein ACI90V_000107 [Bacillariaceae sp.]|jgi:hypothetical protein